MAQAQITLEGTGRRPSALAARWVAFRHEARRRREDKRALYRVLADRELGRATGARV